MTTEQVKNELKDINNKKNRIKALEIKIENRKSLLGIKGISFSDEAGGTNHQTEIDLIHQVNKLEKRKLNLECDLNLLMCFIESLNTNEKQVIKKRYLDNLTLTETSKIVSYDVGHVKRLITSALENITEMYNKLDD